jgi:hypothetical protein
MPGTSGSIDLGTARPANLPGRTPAELFTASHDEPPVPSPVTAAMLDAIEREVLAEDGVPTCAEDAAEDVLARHRPRPRSLYARTVNPVLSAAHLSPHRPVNYATWIGVSTVAAWGSLVAWQLTH